MIVTWSNHNRPLQADQAIEWLAGSTGAEDGQHSALQVFSGATLLVEKLDIDGETATVTTDETGPLTFKLWSKRDGFDSWQINEWTQTQAAPDAGPGTAITSATWVAPTPGTIIDGGGA